MQTHDLTESTRNINTEMHTVDGATYLHNTQTFVVISKMKKEIDETATLLISHANQTASVTLYVLVISDVSGQQLNYNNR